ncbi:ERF family protein [Senegalimassilia anaerobia]|uniref:ERF family protein n=1 Tax=Senegalimassilia anaerobia TaxID=1473216 RepID=UPI00248D884A|nr:ERF family protein [Senegalimassilia anaerobia]
MTQENGPIDLMAAVAKVQRAVVVPKAKYNAFGKFSYRSYEDIVAALKEPCKKEGLAFFLTDELVQIGDRYYVKATACVFPAEGGEGSLQVSAYAREDEHKKGSDDAQVTGMASSYARKYALCGAFAIDGQSDPDGMEEQPAPEEKQPPQDGPFTAHCRSCGARYQFTGMPQ